MLKNKDYIDKIKSTIKRVVAQYAIVNEDSNFFENDNAEALELFYSESTPESLQLETLKINPQTFLDILLLEIRGESIAFSSKLKKQRSEMEQLIVNEIDILQKRIIEANNETNFQLVNNQLQLKKGEL